MKAPPQSANSFPNQIETQSLDSTESFIDNIYNINLPLYSNITFLEKYLSTLDIQIENKNTRCIECLLLEAICTITLLSK